MKRLFSPQYVAAFVSVATALTVATAARANVTPSPHTSTTHANLLAKGTYVAFTSQEMMPKSYNGYSNVRYKPFKGLNPTYKSKFLVKATFAPNTYSNIVCRSDYWQGCKPKIIAVPHGHQTEIVKQTEVVTLPAVSAVSFVKPIEIEVAPQIGHRTQDQGRALESQVLSNQAQIPPVLTAPAALRVSYGQTISLLKKEYAKPSRTTEYQILRQVKTTNDWMRVVAKDHPATAKKYAKPMVVVLRDISPYSHYAFSMKELRRLQGQYLRMANTPTLQ